MPMYRDARNMSISAFLATALIAVRSILVLEIVGPETIGIWKSAMVLFFACEFVRLGLPTGIGLRLPVLLGQKNSGEAELTVRAAGSALIVMGVVVGLLIFGGSFLVESGQYRLALWFVALIIAFSFPQAVLREVAGAHHLFAVRVKEALLEAVVNFVATLVLASLFGLAGLGTAVVLSTLLPALYLWRRLKMPVTVRFDVPRLRTLIGAGLPYSFMESAFHVARYMGVFLIAVMLGPTEAGYYALAMLVMDFSATVARMGISKVITPYLLREYGRVGSLTDVAGFFEAPICLFCYTVPPVIGIGVLVLPEFVNRLLPHYTAGVPAAQTIMWAVFFLALHSTLGPFISAAGKVSFILKFSLALLPVGIGAQYLVIHAGYGIGGVAWTTVVCLGLIATAQLWMAKRESGQSSVRMAAYLVSLYLPFAVCIALTMGIRSLGFHALMPEVLGALVASAIFLVAYVPLLAAYELRFSLIRTVRQAM